MLRENSYGVIPLRRHPQGWEVFLIQHLAGHWGFPKGRPEPQESPEQAAKRELKEETSLTCDRFLLPSPLEEHYQCTKEGQPVDKTVTYFVAEVSGTPFLQTTELQDGKWVPLAEAPQILTFPESQALVKHLLANL